MIPAEIHPADARPMPGKLAMLNRERLLLHRENAAAAENRNTLGARLVFVRRIAGCDPHLVRLGEVRRVVNRRTNHGAVGMRCTAARKEALPFLSTTLVAFELKRRETAADVSDVDGIDCGRDTAGCGNPSDGAPFGIIPVPHSDSQKGRPISFSCRTSGVASPVTPAAHARIGLSKRLPFHHSG